MPMALINAVQAILAVFLILAVLFQVKGTAGGLFGPASSTFRTRRGLEKTLFQATVILAVLLGVIALVNVKLVG